MDTINIKWIKVIIYKRAYCECNNIDGGGHLGFVQYTWKIKNVR